MKKDDRVLECGCGLDRKEVNLVVAAAHMPPRKMPDEGISVNRSLVRDVGLTISVMIVMTAIITANETILVLLLNIPRFLDNIGTV